jgi:dihydrofolate synthase/folylpolyglutamate synthase
MLSLFEKYFGERSEYRSMVLTLGRIDAALSAASPEISGKVVHIAGTNAKGSTSFFIANILKEAGFSVTQFISPHIISIYERLQYNGAFITPSEFDDLFSAYKNTIIEHKLTYFETLFFIFMLYAGIKKPDFLVLETGLGGRFDATNTNYIKRKIPVITNIALDHREILGSNIYSVLNEKLAIIKDNAPIFVGLCKSFIMDEIRTKFASAEIITPSEADAAHALRYVQYPFNNNLALAICVSEYISGRELPHKAYPLPPCRQERFGRFILDGAHNESGLLSLIKSFPNVGGILISTTKERDINKFIRILFKLTKNIIATTIPDNHRSIDSSAVKDVDFIDDPLSALAVLEKRSEGDILVTGSLYLCSFIRHFLSGKKA